MPEGRIEDRRPSWRCEPDAGDVRGDPHDGGVEATIVQERYDARGFQAARAANDGDGARNESGDRLYFSEDGTRRARDRGSEPDNGCSLGEKGRDKPRTLPRGRKEQLGSAARCGYSPYPPLNEFEWRR